MGEILGKENVIRDNYHRVVERITQAARAAGRDPKDIRLVVVTKTQPIEVVRIVVDAGATDLGENYAEEAIPKMHAFAANEAIHWHMIGHVQSRKAQIVCDNFHYIHSLDSVKLAEKLSRSSLALGKSLLVWMEFNTSGEETKTGWNISDENKWENLLPDLEIIFNLPGLEFLGVMTIPPYSSDPESSRSYYKKLRKFQRYLNEHFQLSGFLQSSMGMSSDFEVAIQEGSTCVRIGQAILGPRSG